MLQLTNATTLQLTSENAPQGGLTSDEPPPDFDTAPPDFDTAPPDFDTAPPDFDTGSAMSDEAEQTPRPRKRLAQDPAPAGSSSDQAEESN